MTEEANLVQKVFNENLETALEEALKCDKSEFVAPLTYILKHFSNDTKYTANSEEWLIHDKHEIYFYDDRNLVMTIHGGIEGCGLLTPQTIRKAKKAGLTRFHSADFDKLFEDKYAMTKLFFGGLLPDGRKMQVFTYEQYAEEGMPNEYTMHAVVRPLSLAKKTVSGDHKLIELYDDSQVIVSCGGKKQAKEFLDELAKKDYHYHSLNVYHPYNEPDFDPKKAQGRLLFARGVDWESGVGDYEHSMIDARRSLDDSGFFVKAKMSETEVQHEKLLDSIMNNLYRYIPLEHYKVRKIISDHIKK